MTGYKGMGLLAMVALLGGCGPRGEQIMIQTPQGSAYAQGYGDGCGTARAELGIPDATVRKDVQRFLGDLKYKSGWKTGYEECRFREKRVAVLSEKASKKTVKTY